MDTVNMPEAAPDAGPIAGVRIIHASSRVQLAAYLYGMQTMPEFQRLAQPLVAEHVWGGHCYADPHGLTYADSHGDGDADSYGHTLWSGSLSL